MEENERISICEDLCDTDGGQMNLPYDTHVDKWTYPMTHMVNK